MIQISPYIYLSGAILLLISPLNWLISALAASIFHEFCHFAALRIFHGEITCVKVAFSGCMIECNNLSEWQQFLSILAGPAGSFSLLVFRYNVPLIAVCGFIQGLFNLLPILPLDGGRLLQLLLYRIIPASAGRIMKYMKNLICLLILLISVFLYAFHKTGIISVLMAIIVIIRTAKKNPLQTA